MPIQKTTRWIYHSCPRCHGDLFIDKDKYGWYEECLQCSYRGDLKESEKPNDNSESKPTPIGIRQGEIK